MSFYGNKKRRYKAYSKAYSPKQGERTYHKAPEEIDAEINEFIKENVAELVELKTTVIAISETNIDIIYTLIYRA